jgi:hypothetical protein
MVFGPGQACRIAEDKPGCKKAIGGKDKPEDSKENRVSGKD